MDKQTKVAIVGAYPREEGLIVGGVEAVTSALCDGLVGTGECEVHVVTSVSGISKPVEWASSTGVIVHQIPLFGKLGCLTGFAVDSSRIRRCIASIAPDIVHVHTTLHYAHAALERGWPSVLTIHGIYYLEAGLQTGWRGLQSRFACRYERGAAKRARHIIAINHYAAECLQEHITTTDVRYIDNPIDDGFFDVEDRAEPGRVLYGALIYERKNLLGLLEAVRLVAPKHPHINLRVAGRVVSQDYYKRCLAFVRENGLERNVDFIGSQSLEEMKEEIARASIVSMTSRQETAPMIISESMAAGKVVVSTPAGGTAEMVMDGKTGFVVPHDDAQALADRIDQVFNSPALAAELSANARQEAESRFRRSVVVDKTMDFYDYILGVKAGDEA